MPSPTVTVEIVTASKKLVAELRALDTHNRPKRKTHVEYLRREIREGRWLIHNQGIGVTASGWLCDGGHRLEALWLEGCPPVPFILVRGLADEAQRAIDQHAKRSMVDTFALFFEAVISGSIVAALSVSLKARGSWSNVKPSPSVLIADFREKEETIRALLGVEKVRRLAAPVLAALLDTLHATQDERVLTFADQVIRGEMLQPGSPSLTLRNWLGASPAASGGSSNQRERYLKTLSALSAFLENRTLTKLYVRELAAA